MFINQVLEPPKRFEDEMEKRDGDADSVAKAAEGFSTQAARYGFLTKALNCKYTD